MICEEAVAILEERYNTKDISLSVPMFLGTSGRKMFTEGVNLINIPFSSPYGMMALSLGFKDNNQDQLMNLNAHQTMEAYIGEAFCTNSTLAAMFN